MATSTPEVFEARRDALLQAGKAAGAQVIVLFGYGSALGAGTVSHGHIRFFSGWDGHESLSLLIITSERTRLVVGSPFMVAAAQFAHPDLSASYVHPTQWAQVLEVLLNKSAFASVGFAELPAHIDRRFTAAGFCPALALDETAARLALVKDASALAAMRAAAALCDDLFGRLGEQLATRRPAWELQLSLEAHARRAGADYCRTWLTLGPEADYPRYWPEECRAVPQPGDQVLFGIALTVEGHWGHGIRMGSVGPQKPEHAALAAEVEAMLKAGVAALRPGQTLTGVEAAMEHVFTRSLAPRYRGGFRRFRNGHGLGTSYEEPLTTAAFRQHFDPAAVATPCDITLEPGMVFELHPNIFVKNLGGAALGEMMLVRDGEPEFLLRFPRTCPVWE